MDASNFGRTLIGGGAILMVLGLFFLFRDRVPGLDRLGRLPGDFRFESENVKIYVPLATSLLLSALASAVLWLFRR